MCKDGKEALETYHSEQPDLLVLDVMMPGKDGLSLAREIRQLDLHLPIIFLTAKTQTADVLEGFHSGGNDYLKKPFSLEELIVRIQNLLNRKKLQQDSETFRLGSFLFDFPRQSLSFGTETELLTHREAQLLFHLCQNRNEVLDRSLVLKKLWGDDDFFSARSMDVFISKLRKKLGKDPQVQIINIRGYGYKLIY